MGEEEPQLRPETVCVWLKGGGSNRIQAPWYMWDQMGSGQYWHKCIACHWKGVWVSEDHLTTPKHARSIATYCFGWNGQGGKLQNAQKNSVRKNPGYDFEGSPQDSMMENKWPRSAGGPDGGEPEAEVEQPPVYEGYAVAVPDSASGQSSAAGAAAASVAAPAGGASPAARGAVNNKQLAHNILQDIKEVFNDFPCRHRLWL